MLNAEIIWTVVTRFGSTSEKWANIGLYLPLGLLATLLWRYPVRVVAGCALLSFLIEAWQGLIGRGGDAVDVVHNAFGALLGALLAAAWTRALLAGESPWPPRTGSHGQTRLSEFGPILDRERLSRPGAARGR